MGGNTNEWITGVTEGFGINEPEDAMDALRAVLRALGRALPAESVASLRAQLPPSIGAMLEEGVTSGGRGVSAETAREFVSLVGRQLPRASELHPEPAIRAVVGMLSRRIDPHELSKILLPLPRSLRGLSALRLETHAN